MAYLLNQDDEVLDALMWSESPDGWWADEKLALASDFLFSKGAWISKSEGPPEPADAVSSAFTAASRSISRDEDAQDTDGPSDWYTTVASGATPGKKNNPKRYQPK
jgi:hypothetical protein